MSRKFYFSFLTFLFFVPMYLGILYSQLIWKNSSVMTAGDGQKKWSRIGCSDDGSLVYVELENGIAYRSKDFGVSWTKLF